MLVDTIKLTRFIDLLKIKSYSMSAEQIKKGWSNQSLENEGYFGDEITKRFYN